MYIVIVQELLLAKGKVQQVRNISLILYFFARVTKLLKRNNGRGLLASIRRLSNSMVIMQLTLVTGLQHIWNLEGSFFFKSFALYISLYFKLIDIILCIIQLHPS